MYRLAATPSSAVEASLFLANSGSQPAVFFVYRYSDRLMFQPRGIIPSTLAEAVLMLFGIENLG